MTVFGVVVGMLLGVLVVVILVIRMIGVALAEIDAVQIDQEQL